MLKEAAERMKHSAPASTSMAASVPVAWQHSGATEPQAKARVEMRSPAGGSSGRERDSDDENLMTP